MNKLINDSSIRALLKNGAPGRYCIGRGLYFRKFENDTGSWVIRYSINNKRREITLGKYGKHAGELSLSKAILEAEKIKAGLNDGIDPLAERRRSNAIEINTVNALAQDWLKECSKRLKHPEIPRRVYEKDISKFIGDISLKRVSPIDIRQVIETINESGRPTIANDALMYLKQLFRHGVRLGLIDKNPADSFSCFHAGGVEKSRVRALNREEIRNLYLCFQKYNESFTRENYLAVSLLILLGVRKGELFKAKWENLNLEKGVWEVPKENSKTNVGQLIPLGPLSLKIFVELKNRSYKSEYVFPNRKASKRSLHVSLDTLNAALCNILNKADVEVEHFTVHDLRRTFRSLLAKNNIPPHIAERCLNHKIKGVEGIYDRYDYFEERRQALLSVEKSLGTIIYPIENIIDFKKSA